MGDIAKLKEQSPVFFYLMQIQMPVDALTFITHRVTGVLLALGIPADMTLAACCQHISDRYHGEHLL
jgi:hypothetical protein